MEIKRGSETEAKVSVLTQCKTGVVGTVCTILTEYRYLFFYATITKSTTYDQYLVPVPIRVVE